MSIETDIIDWAATRPHWQKEVLRRLARGERLSAADIQTLADQTLGIGPPSGGNFALEDLPTALRYARERIEDAIKVVVKARGVAARREAAE